MNCGGSAGILTEMLLANTTQKNTTYTLCTMQFYNMNVCVCMCVSYCTSSFIEQELHMELVY